MSAFDTLNAQVIGWAEDKGILDKSDPKSQCLKSVSEMGELADAILAKDEAEIIDALGDVMVTLIILAELNNLNIVDCLASAYTTISTRTGSMHNGAFVKDSI